MPSLARRIAAASPVLILALNACLPYTVGSTAQTVPAHETTRSTSWYFIPNAVKLPEDSIAGPLYGTNFEYRRGLDQKSDFGLRLMPGGVQVDYKRRVDGDASRAALAYMVGGGIVNGGEHFMMQGTLLVSGHEDAALVPYGGLRAIHVLPISQYAVSDRPTIGAFAGLQIGDAEFAIRPELGVYYDHSALGLRRGDLIVVPAVTLKRGPRRQLAREGAQRPRPVSPALPSDPRRTPGPFTTPPIGR
jgi:hypothetical protein